MPESSNRKLQQEFFPPSEIGTYLGFSAFTIRELCREGKLRHVKTGKLILIRKEWADQFMAAGERKPIF